MTQFNEPISQESQGLGVIAPEARDVVKQMLNGDAMDRLTMQRKSEYMDLMNSGRSKDSTVINFNPVSLKVEDQNVPWRIPAAPDKLGKKIKVEFDGQTYIASYFTLRKEMPRFYAMIRDVNKPSDANENPTAVYDPKFITPLELMDQYRIQYTNPQFIPMGGVIVYEGDIHQFINDKGAFAKTLRIPNSTRLPDGRRSYFSQEMSLMSELALTLDMQKSFCQGMITQGDEYNQDEQDRKNITSVHRIWLQYALDMGWKQNSSPWMSAQLDSEESCKGCGKGKTRKDAWACVCGRYYNPLAAFLAGQPVPESFIYALTGADFDKAATEMKRRNDIRIKLGLLGGDSQTPPAL